MKPTPSMRWTISPVAWVPISLAVAAEAISNSLRAYSLGGNLERFTVQVLDVPVSVAGAVLVLAAVAVSLSQTRAAWVACTPGDARQRLISGLAACLLLTISVSAMASHILEAQRAKTGSEKTAGDTYINAKADYERTIAELAKVASARTVSQVQAAMDAIPVDTKIRMRTKNCTDITTRASQDECAPVTALKPDMAEALRKAELEASLPSIKANLDGLKMTDQVGRSEAGVSTFWAWSMGLGVVFIATFGSVIFARVEKTELQERPQVAVIPRKAIPRNPNGGKRGRKANATIVNFAESFKAKHGRRPSGSEIRAYFPGVPVSTAYDYAKRV